MGGELFGGGEESTGTSTTSSEPWKEVQPYLTDLFAKAKAAQVGLTKGKMPDQLSAGLTPEQLQAQQMQLGTAGMIQGQLPNSMNALNQGFNAMNLENNPYFSGAVDAATRPAIKNFERKTMPGIAMNSVANAGFGSSRQGIAEGIALSDLNTQIGDISSSMANDAYQKGQDTMVRSLALAPNTYSSMLMPSTITAGVGAQNQAMEQQMLNDALTKWNFDRTKTMDSLQQYAQLLQGNWGGTSTSTGSVPTQSGGIGGAIGGGLAGYSAAGPVGGVIGAIGGLF